MRTVHRLSVSLLAIAVAVALLGSALAPAQSQASVTAMEASNSDWAQVQKNPQRTGFSSETLGTNFKVAWTRAFQPERVHPQVQAKKLFVASEVGQGNAGGAALHTGVKRGLRR